MSDQIVLGTRTQVIHALHEAAELEHNLMCAYLYAAFSLKDGKDGLARDETEAVERWRRDILAIAREEMSHLTAVWNITAAIGGSPRFGRSNFPLEPGYLPSSMVVKLAPFSPEVLQHFIYLERPEGSDEPVGDGFDGPRFARGSVLARPLTPSSFDYATVGTFYRAIEDALADLAARIGEAALFCGDRALQMSPAEAAIEGAHVVGCSRTAVEALALIVTEGEGAAGANVSSHFSRFMRIRDEYRALLAKNPGFRPAHPAAIDPALRRPPTDTGRVWIGDAETAAVADLGNAVYETVLRLLAHAYSLASPHPEKAFSVQTATRLMPVLTLLAESAARRPAGPGHPHVNGGLSFVALRDAAPLPVGPSARRLLAERLHELADGAVVLDQLDPRLARAAAILKSLSEHADEAFLGPASSRRGLLEQP